MFQRWNLCGYSLDWFSSNTAVFVQAFNVKPSLKQVRTFMVIPYRKYNYIYMYMYRKKRLVWLWRVIHEANVALSAYIKLNTTQDREWIYSRISVCVQFILKIGNSILFGRVFFCYTASGIQTHTFSSF